MGSYIMTIDQGTTGSRAMLVNQEGHIISSEYSEFPQIYPKPGWVEHDAEIIWETTLKVMKESVQVLGISPKEIKGIGITNQRETTVLWDRNTLKPVHNAIVWQCRRSSDICDKLKKQGYDNLVRTKTGLVLDAYFSGTKIKWLLDNVPGLRERCKNQEIAFGTIDTWIIAKLTRGKVHVTDYTNASRTLIYNIHEKQWDDELLKMLDIPSDILPKVVPSSGYVGDTSPEIFDIPIPIAGIAGDQQAALFGQACFADGEAKNTYGTGCFLLLNVADKKIDPKGLIVTLACDAGGNPCYALEGSIFIAGAVVQWLRDGLQVIKTARETSDIAKSISGNDGVFMVPAFAGLGAPHWDMYARGGIFGLTRSTTRAHIVRAALEGIAFQVKDLINTFSEAANKDFQELRVDGGATKNDFLMQFQADILGCPINRSQYVESTGMGAAFLAGIATNFWSKGNQIKELRKSEKIFNPMISKTESDKLYKGWFEAVERVKTK